MLVVHQACCMVCDGAPGWIFVHNNCIYWNTLFLISTRCTLPTNAKMQAKLQGKLHRLCMQAMNC